MLKFVNKLLKNENGATAIEYVLLAGLISIAAIAAMTSVGDSIEATFKHVGDEVGKAKTATQSNKAP